MAQIIPFQAIASNRVRMAMHYHRLGFFRSGSCVGRDRKLAGVTMSAFPHALREAAKHLELERRIHGAVSMQDTSKLSADEKGDLIITERIAWDNVMRARVEFDKLLQAYMDKERKEQSF